MFIVKVIKIVIMIVDSYGKMRFVRKNFKNMKNKLLHKHSPAEEHFENLLIKANLFYVREKCNFKYDTRWCYYDFFIPFYRLYIEIDGDSHKGESQKKIDAQKDKIIKNKQRFIVRLTNEEVLSMNSFEIDDILERLFVQIKKNGVNNPKGKYYENLEFNHSQSLFDMSKNAKFDIDREQKVYMYDHSTGNTYEFDNIMVAKLHTHMTINEIYDMLTDKEYTYHSSRRYAFGWTIVECTINAFKGCCKEDTACHDGEITYEIKAELKRGRTCTKCPFSNNKILLASEDCYKNCEFFRGADIKNKILHCGYPKSNDGEQKELLRYKISQLQEQINSLQKELEDYKFALDSLY